MYYAEIRVLRCTYEAASVFDASSPAALATALAQARVTAAKSVIAKFRPASTVAVA
jgi:hypothetical protein